MRKWKGSCTEASIHMFLACGLIAKSTSNLEFLPGLIFGKRWLLSSGSTSSTAAERQRVRKCFNCDVEPSSVIHNYLKKEHVAPKEAHQFEVFLETWGLS
jgi:hypothetical protein